MRIVRRVVFHRLEVEALEDLQRFQQHDALAPDIAGMHGVTAVVHRNAVFHRHFKTGQVLEGHEAAVGGVVIGDFAGNRAAVEIVMHGRELFVAVAAAIALGLDQPADGAGEVLLHKEFADARRAPLGQEDAFIVGPAPEAHFQIFDVGRQQRINGEAVFRQLHRRRCRLFEGNRAVAAQRRNIGGGRRRYHRAQQVFRHGLAVAGRNQLRDIGLFRPVTETRETDDLVELPHVDQRRRDAGEAHHVRLQHRQRHRCRDAGINRIAAAVKHAHRGQRRQIVSGRSRVVTADHVRPQARRRHGHFDCAFFLRHDGLLRGGR